MGTQYNSNNSNNKLVQNSRHHSAYDNNDPDEELVTINGITGVIVNRDEIENWRGPIPLSEYPINVDPNPIVIRKKMDTPVINNRQNVYIRYLRPPTPPPHGDLIIQQDQHQYIEPPPIVLREMPAKTKKNNSRDDVIIIREAPPKEYLSKSANHLNVLREASVSATKQGQAKQAKKTIKFLGYNFTLGSRKLIIERRPPTPEKPQSIIVERWLAPTSKQRRAVFRANNGEAAPFSKNSTIRNDRFDQDMIYDEIRL